MTLQDLRQYSSTRAEIKRLSRRLNELRLELAENHEESTIKVMSKLYVELEKLQRQQLSKEYKITKQIEMIEDIQARIMIQLHYIDGYTWNKVADEIGGGNTEDSCRMYVNRYLRKLFDMSQKN